MDVRFVPGKHIITLSNQRRYQFPHTRDTTHRFNAEVIATHTIEYNHIEWSGGCPLFSKTTHMEPTLIRTSVHDLVNGSGLPMEGKHHGFVFREMLNEALIIQAVWVQFGWIQNHEVYHIDHAHFQFWNVMS